MIIKIKTKIRGWLRSAFYSIYEYLLSQRRGGRETSQYFPLCHGKNYLHEPLHNSNDDRLYFAKYYQDGIENPLAVEFSKFRTEVVSGQSVAAGKRHKSDMKIPGAVPVSINLEGPRKVDVVGNYTIYVTVDGASCSLRNLAGDRFYYLPFHQGGSVELECSENLIVGDPLPFTQKKRHKKKLVVMLYVDSVTPEIFAFMDKEKDLPNISRFFSAGMQFENCHANSEWTKSSVPTIISGKHPLRHGIFAPSNQNLVGQDYTLISERFHDAGYMTFLATPFWGTAPSYGYTKGFDRTIYKRHMSLEESLGSAYENIRAFPDRDQFLLLGLSEFHNHVNLLPDISAQVRMPIEGNDYRFQVRGPLRSEDASQRARAIEELKRIDFYLGLFFSFVEEHYTEDEFLVTMFADHGVRYLRNTPHLLTTDLTHVPFYLRGGGVKVGISEEFVETCDIAPTLLDLAGLPPLDDIEGRLPETFGGGPAREMVFTESYYPGRPFHATVKDKGYELFITSEGLVAESGHFDMGTPDLKLFPFGDYTNDIAAENEDIVTRLYDALTRRMDEIKQKMGASWARTSQGERTVI